MQQGKTLRFFMFWIRGYNLIHYFYYETNGKEIKLINLLNTSFLLSHCIDKIVKIAKFKHKINSFKFVLLQLTTLAKLRNSFCEFDF